VQPGAPGAPAAAPGAQAQAAAPGRAGARAPAARRAPAAAPGTRARVVPRGTDHITERLTRLARAALGQLAGPDPIAPGSPGPARSSRSLPRRAPPVASHR